MAADYGWFPDPGSAIQKWTSSKTFAGFKDEAKVKYIDTPIKNARAEFVARGIDPDKKEDDQDIPPDLFPE